MPSRKTVTPPKRTQNNKPKQAKTKPEVSVTENSTPEEILSSSWMFITAFQFFHTFRGYFRLPSFDIEKLEAGLLKEQDDFIETFLIQVLTPFLGPEQKKKISVFNYEKYLVKVFPAFFSTEITTFYKLDVMDKIKLLKLIEDQTIDSPTDSFNSWKAESSPDDLRIQPLGTDNDGWTYWYFGGFRLYREIPIPKSDKRGKEFLNTNDFTFELVCSNEEEWNKIMKKFQPSKRASSLSIQINEIGASVINKMEAREATRLKNEAKMKRAKELELLPRKRSRRLEVKHDEEEKRRKIEEDIKQQELFEEYERKKKKEQEQEHIRINVDNLKEQVRDYIENQIAINDTPQLRELLNKLSKHARESVRARRMQGWIALYKNGNNIQFNNDDFIITSDNENALKEVLVKNTLRVYLTTVSARLESDHPIKQIYNDLMLDKYQSLQEFNTALAQATVDDLSLREHTSRLLNTVFNEPFF